MKTQKPKAKSRTLKRIGLWATIWWGVSGLYVVLLVWLSRNEYVELSDWRPAISNTYHDSAMLPVLLALIITVWIVGAWIWLKELRRQKISYKAAFKDLFLTLRR